MAISPMSLQDAQAGGDNEERLQQQSFWRQDRCYQAHASSSGNANVDQRSTMLTPVPSMHDLQQQQLEDSKENLMPRSREHAGQGPRALSVSFGEASQLLQHSVCTQELSFSLPSVEGTPAGTVMLRVS